LRARIPYGVFQDHLQHDSGPLDASGSKTSTSTRVLARPPTFGPELRVQSLHSGWGDVLELKATDVRDDPLVDDDLVLRVGRRPEASAFVWTEATRAEANAAKFGADLGLDPAGRAKLAKDLGVAVHFGGDQLADLAEQGRAIREQRQAELDADDKGDKPSSRRHRTRLTKPLSICSPV
jgi:hypothetical protein